MRSRRRVRAVIRGVVGIAAGAAALGCGGKGSGMPDAIPIVDATTTAITIRTFPDGFPYTGRTENATLVAFKDGDGDGDGAWVALTGTAGIYNVTATGERYSVAVGCASDLASSVDLYYQSVSDITDLYTDGCPSSVDTVHVSITVQGLQADDTAEVWLGGYWGSAPAGDTIELDVPKGPVDVFARSYVVDIDSSVAVTLYRGPAMDLEADRSLTINMAAMGKQPESHALTVIGVMSVPSAPATVDVGSSYTTPHSQLQWPLYTQEFAAPLATPPDQYLTLPAAMRGPDDVSNITVFADNNFIDGTGFERYVRLAMKTPVAQTLALPELWTADAPKLDRALVPRATLTIPITPATLGTSDYHATLSGTTASGADHVMTVFLRPGWAAGHPSVTITTPDLTALPGWSTDQAFAGDATVSWTLEWDDRNMPYNTDNIDGKQIRGSQLFGFLGP